VASRRKNAYQIYDVVVGADFHPEAGDYLDDLNKIGVLSETTRGPYTVVKLASTYWFDKGSDDHQRAGTHHMVLMVKLDKALTIVDAYIFVLEWAEQPMILYWMREGAAMRTLDIPGLKKPSSPPSKLTFGDHLDVSDLNLVSDDGLSPPDWMNGVLDTLVLKGLGAKAGPCWLGAKPATALDRTGAPCPRASPAK
jgi:hypothetical protein